MKDLVLIYINKVGEDHEGNMIYEFIFSDSCEKIDAENWDLYPASGRAKPPHKTYIKKVGILESELYLDVIQDSDTFAVWDAVDGVIALAWENVNHYDTYPDKRLSFRFGEPIKDVEDKLYEKDLTLQYRKKAHEKEN